MENSAVEWFAQNGRGGPGDPLCADPQVQVQHCALRMKSEDPSEHLFVHLCVFELFKNLKSFLLF